MVRIIFESHGTTFDNEAHRASGWFDVDLSPLGEQQACELGACYRGQHLDAVTAPWPWQPGWAYVLEEKTPFG